MGNTSALICTEWKYENPGKERFALCITMFTEVLMFGPPLSKMISFILDFLTKTVEFCDIIYLQNTTIDYLKCREEHGRAYGFCDIVFSDNNSTDFWGCFHMVKRFEEANPDKVVTKWRFYELVCNGSRLSDFCDEYYYTQEHVFSKERKYLSTYFSDVYHRYIIPSIGTVTLITNGLILFILSAHMSTNSNIILLRMKSISDTLMVVFQMPVLLYFGTFRENSDFIPYEQCVLIILTVDILPVMFHRASILIALGISFQKCFIVNFPLKVSQYLKPKYTVFYSVFCFCIPLAVMMPPVLVLCNAVSLEVQSKDVYDKDIITMLMTMPTGQKWMNQVNESISLIRTLILQCLPCSFLFAFELIGIRRSIRYIKTKKQMQGTSASGPKIIIQVVHMSMANVCIFLAAELPNTVALRYYSISEIGFSKTYLLGVGLDTLTWLSSLAICLYAFYFVNNSKLLV